MLYSKRSRFSRAIGRTALVGIVVIVIIIIVVGAYATLTIGPSTTTQSTSSTSTSSTATSTSSSISTTTTTTQTTSTISTTSTQAPTSLTYETLSTAQYLDPQVSYDIFGANVEQNIYEPLLWYAGSNGSAPVPWLASNYSVAADGKSMVVNLRSNIAFADGEQLNSSAVYFSLNRLLIFDGSTPVGHGSQASWILQQLENHSLSTTLCCAQTYSVPWTNRVLAQNFVQITGPLSVTLNIQNPNAALPYLIANLWANIVAPDWVMQKDIALWVSKGYTLPYTSPGGNATAAINQYFYDEVSTCDTGVTPHGCGATYLDQSIQGSLAGTGPYVISSVNPSTNDIALQANTHFWGGPLHITPHYQTVNINFVPSQPTRLLDLQNAARSGQALVADLTGDNLYGVADRNQWLNNNTLVSDIQGVRIYGPFSQYAVLFDPLETNVSNPMTGSYYKFQPFADIRLRLAFADAVNISDVNVHVNNKLGLVANEVIPPGFPPGGAYNASITPRYSFDLTAVQNILLSAMTTPLTSFNFKNGTLAPPGYFNNTFGCATLNSNGQCSTPVPQTIPLVYATGATVDAAILTQIASAINNVSATYNMGLTVTITPIPAGQMITEAFSGETYMWAESVFGWFDDYPWATDFLGPILSPGGLYASPGGFNLTLMQTYWNSAQQASSSGNIPALVRATNQMAELANQAVMDIWTFYPDIYMVLTSNIHGFYFNPAIYTTGGPQYYAALS